MRARWYVLVPLLSVAATLLALELALALFRPVSRDLPLNMVFEPDPHTGYRLKPHGRGSYQLTIPAVANRHGHRDDDVALEKPPGTFRVLVLGDSFTVGAGVRQEDAYPQRLEAILNERSRRPVEVVNAAVGGWDPFQYAQYYEHYGRRFSPDLVLIGLFVGNDAFSVVDAETQMTAVRGRRVRRDDASTSFLVVLYERSHLFRFLWRNAVATLDPSRADCNEVGRRNLSIQRARLPVHRNRALHAEGSLAASMRQLERIRVLAASEGIPVVVALLPDETQVNPEIQRLLVDPAQRSDYDFDMPQAVLVEQLRERGVATLDLLPAFRGDSRCLYQQDTHFNPAGHEVAAVGIAAELRVD